MFITVWVRTKAAPHIPRVSANSHQPTVNIARQKKPTGRSPPRPQVKLGVPCLSMKLLAALPVFCLLALASAQDSPQRCTSPDQMDGMLTTFHPVNFIENYGNFSYDAVNKRLYKSVFVFRGGIQAWKQVDILLFQKSMKYQYFPHNGTCLKSPLRTPFPKFGVSKNAKFLSQLYIGSAAIPKAGLLTNIWSKVEDNENHVMTFTDVKCLPQYRAHFREDGWFSESFYNLALKIRDPTVFTPPSECDDAV